VTADPATTAGPRPEAHHAHRDVGGGWLRPSVFGAMDGLVTDLALIAGIAAAGARQHVVVLTGLAGLVAGAFSMAMGEYTSVCSQRELVEREIEVERREIARRPQAEQEELAQLYRRRGVAIEVARDVARQLSVDPEQALRIHVREELGVDPEGLPSPVVAAISSFVSFGLGAALPLLPYAAGGNALWISVVLSAVALFGLGASVTRFTGRSALYGGLRQLLLGAVAASITYAIGRAVGAGVS
jgi:VIT1/CCC1 family predicted Fe2+/Mn2+ transporter